MANGISDAQQLVAEYLECLEAKAIYDDKLAATKQKLLDYSQKFKKKMIKGDRVILTVSVKRRTVFPKLNQPGRKELEKIVRDSGYLDKAVSFDVVKLAEAFDNNQLPGDLRKSLEGYVKKEDLVKIYVNYFNVKSSA